MKWFRRPFMILGIICLIIGLVPGWQYMRMGALPDGRKETSNVFTFGVPPSPLLVVKLSHSEQRHGTEKTICGSSSYELEFVSWSMLSLILAALFFVVDSVWRRNRNSRFLGTS
jgi:hypothetical protein